MQYDKTKADFSGWATKYNVLCEDGRTIMPSAFTKQNGSKVPLVIRHIHDDMTAVIGHTFLEMRDEGMYTYSYLNDSPEASSARIRINHKDIDSFSIFANKLVEKSKSVIHGVIREVSLVLSGANPGAKIDYITIQHGADGDFEISDEEAIIYSGETIDVIKHESKSDKDVLTYRDIFNTLNDEQRELFYDMTVQVMEASMETSASDDEVKQDGIDSDNIIQEGDETKMKTNVFTKPITEDGRKAEQLFHDSMSTIMTNARKLGSLSQAYAAYVVDLSEEDRTIMHAGTYGIGSDRENLELLFPDAVATTGEPMFISRSSAWVKNVMNGTHKSPFSRIKSLMADITVETARAKGYITGNEKIDEVFPVLKRVTTPTTVYKKQKLDRDDIIDITGFDVVKWLKKEMRVMLDEELALGTLIGDGRAVDDDDRIDPTHIRPIYGDSTIFVHYEQEASSATALDLIDAIITMRINYKGSGSPTLYCAPSFLSALLLIRDLENRRMYRNVQELAAELMVANIIEVPQMEDVSRTVSTVEWNLRAIVVNLADYTHGADRGGEVSFFDDFDIDFNQYKYLLETRLCGALTMPDSALVLEQAVV